MENTSEEVLLINVDQVMDDLYIIGKQKNENTNPY